MSNPDPQHCQACIGEFCTAKAGCVVLDRGYDVTCARCGKVGPAETFIVEEADEWECVPCWEREEAKMRSQSSVSADQEAKPSGPTGET